MHQAEDRDPRRFGARALAASAFNVFLVLNAGPALAATSETESAAHYDVRARFDAASGYLRASVVVTLPQSQVQEAPSFLLNERFKLDASALGPGVHATIAPSDRPIGGLQSITLRFDRPPAAPQRLRFEYQGLAGGFDDPAISSERIELRLERFWLPLRSDLRLSFTVDADIRGLPEAVAVATQGEYRRTGSRLTVHRGIPDLDLPIAGTPGMRKHVAADIEFFTNEPDDPLVAVMREHCVGAAAFFRALYGPPQAGPLRVVVVPRDSGGAYARRNFLVLPTYRKPGDAPPPFEPSRPARTVAHEIEHAWMPTPAVGGENYWVSESVAEYMALRYIASAFGAQQRDAMVAIKRTAALEAGSLLTERRPDNAALYQKGPLLIAALAERIGSDKLDGILTRRDRPRTHRAFLTLLTAQAGEDVARDFEAQLGQSGLPAAIAGATAGDAASSAADPRADAPAAVSTRYSIVMSGTVKGGLTVERQGAARRSVLRYDDRGRGPELTTQSRYTAGGLLESVQVDGVDYAKRGVAERFSTQGGRARWISGADSGEQTAGAYYLINDSNAEDLAALARALLDAPGGELTMLPAGRARIEKVLEREVRAGERSVSATLYLISGLGLQPAEVWLDTQRELFAAGGNWLATVRQGFESVLPDLFAAEDQTATSAAQARNRGLRRTPGRPVLFRNANVYDAEQRTLRPGLSVLVRGDRIAAVGSETSVAAPADAEIIDAHGGTLLPGLWDMHVHVLDPAEGLLDLLAGVTTVRDLGNDDSRLQGIVRQYDDGTAAGPRVLKAGLIEGPGPLAAPFGRYAETPAQMREAVDFYADRGYAQVKLYSSLAPQLVGEAVAHAHQRGLRVGGHVPAGMTMEQAVDAGFDEVHHANFWFLNFMPADIVARTNSPVRFSAVYEHGRELDLASPAAQNFISRLVARGTVVDPTLVVFENMFTGSRGVLAPWMKPWSARLPATLERSGRSGGRATTPEQRAAYTESFARMKQMLRALHAAGVPIVPGTDGSPLQLSRELELYVESGIPPADVLYMATLGSARVMKQDADVGSIAVGKRADLVLIEGDPVREIGALRNARLVMKGGDIYDAGALAKAAGLIPAPQAARAPAP